MRIAETARPLFLEKSQKALLKSYSMAQNTPRFFFDLIDSCISMTNFLFLLEVFVWKFCHMQCRLCRNSHYEEYLIFILQARII